MQQASEPSLTPSTRPFIARPPSPAVQIAPTALSASSVDELANANQSLPLANSRTGNIFQDRFVTNLAWYLPSVVLAPDVDPAFAFNAIQSGVDIARNPFDQVTLTFGLVKQKPDDAVAYGQQHPACELREIPIDSIAATLTTTAPDPQTGAAHSATYPGTLTMGADGTLSVTFGGLTGTAVVVAYDNLQRGGAVIALTGSYAVWRETVYQRPFPIFHPQPIRESSFPPSAIGRPRPALV